jgi:hypothetical protein
MEPYTYAEFKRSLDEEPWQWNPQMLAKFRRHPFLGWLANRATISLMMQDKKRRDKKGADALADYRRVVMSIMQHDPRWRQHFRQSPDDVIDALGTAEDFAANLSDCFTRGVPFDEYADNMVRLFTEGPMPFAVQAALSKLGREE